MKLFRRLAASAALLCAGVLHAQTVSPVPAPTIIKTAPYTISAAGYYQLGADLTVASTSGNIITINASNVTLDFAGHYISGPGNAAATSTLYGVSANEEGNIMIKNGTVAFCNEGISFQGNATSSSIEVNETVQNMLVTYCSHVGIKFQNANYCTAINNNVSNISGYTASNGTSNYGFYCLGTGETVSNNKVVLVSGPSAAIPPSGIAKDDGSVVAVGNQLISCTNAIYHVSACQNNLAVSCGDGFPLCGDGGGNESF